MTVGKHLALSVMLTLGIGSQISSANAEGINCAKAQTKIDKAVCADPDLRALDTRIATAYSRLIKELDPQSAEALKKDQRWFLGARNSDEDLREGSVDKQDLSDTLQFRAKFLESIIAHPRPGFSGRWENVAGTLNLEESSGKRVTFDGNAADPQSQRWVCEAAGDGPLINGKAQIAIDTDDGAWTLTASRDGATLDVEETAPAKEGGVGSPPYCGFNGTFSGVYFQTAK